MAEPTEIPCEPINHLWFQRVILCRFGKHAIYWEEDAPEGGRQQNCAACGGWFKTNPK
jgi:hypothetical protein